MRLKQRIILLFTALFFSAIVLLGLVLYQFSIYSYEQIEIDEMRASLQRLDNAFGQQIDGVAGKGGEWAYWDDAYDYSLGLYPEFIANEVIPGYIGSIEMNFLCHLDRGGNIIHTEALRNFSDSEFDNDLRDQFNGEIGSKWPTSDEPEPWKGIMTMTGLPPVVIASTPVVRSNGEGPPSGSVIFAQFFDDEMVHRMSENLLYEITAAQVGSDDTASDMKSALDRLTKGENDVMQATSINVFSGYYLIRDIEGNPVMVLRLDMPRNAFMQGQRTTMLLLLSLLAIVLFLGFSMYIVIGRIVVNPITRLSRAVQSIASGERPNLGNVGHDEISILGREIGRTVKKLDDSTAIIADSAADLRKYKRAMEQVSDMILITDGDYQIIFANRAAEIMTGYSHDELIGGDALRIWAEDKAVADSIRNDVERKVSNISREVQSPKKNGEKYTAELHLSTLSDDLGHIQYIVAVSYDITQAKEIDRMKTEFVSVASHQLKSPLTDIRWITEMLMEEKGALTESQREYLGQILLVNDRLIQLVNDLLNVSRIETGRKFDIVKEPVDIMTIVERAIVDQGIVAHQKDIRISAVEGVPNNLTVSMDKEKIYQVMHNLINNAVKYSPEGSTVSVDVEDGVQDVTVSVHDQGIGIPEAEHDKVFGKFFRAQNVGDKEGTGLGLYIVKAIVEAHGGRIWFESVEGKGTIFRFTVPKA